MSYRTTCPQCVSVFRLGADQLDAAQGWVQCSVCGAAFDAHPSLLMEDGSPLPPVESEIIEVSPLADAPGEGEPEPDEIGLASAPPDLPSEAGSETPEMVEETPPAAPPRGIVQREGASDLPSIILIDPAIPVADDPGPLPHIGAPGYTYDPAAPVYPRAPDALAAPLPITRIEYATPTTVTTQVPRAPRRGKTWIWAIASVLLLLLLLGQTAYFLRDTLVSRLPQTRPVIEQACAQLGCTLSLPKNLAQLQIVGSDLQTETRDRMRLTLTLGNRAAHVQAWPVLVLTLTDQRNQPLARRSFAPSEYLGDPRRIAAGIPPRTEQPLSLPLSVDNLAPMGFGLQLTY